MEEIKEQEKVKKIHHTDVIEIDNRIIFIPDKYLEHTFLSQEHKKCYKYMLGLCLIYHYNHQLGKLTKVKINQYIQLTDKLFAYLETGQLIGSYNFSTPIEKYILSKIPQYLFIKQNPLLTEKNDN